MTLPARAAALRGDDYQHTIGLYHAGRVLTDPRLESVSIEDADGGAFDDVVVRPRPDTGRPVEYHQVKSSVHLASAVDDAWLTQVKTPRGRSPLQHFHHTWRAVRATAEAFELKLITNKNFDDTNPILGIIDLHTDTISRLRLSAFGTRSGGGRQLAAWAEHLGIEIEELIDFLSDVQFVHAGSVQTWERMASAELRNAGLRFDPDAIELGRAMVREWVMTGAGVRTTADIRADVSDRGLLACGGELLLAVHGIDHVQLDRPPNASVDIVDLYPDASPFQRRELTDPVGWHDIVLPNLERARRDLSGFRSRRLRLEAAMRLPMYFAVGRTFPDVAGWVVSTDQRGVLWHTDVSREPAEIRSTTHEIGNGTALAIGVALTVDLTDAVRAYLDASGMPVGRLQVFTTPDGPSPTSVPGPGWAATWARGVREQVRAAQAETGAQEVHLFLSAPAAMAMFLGHDWNMIRNTTVYDHTGETYLPTMTLSG